MQGLRQRERGVDRGTGIPLYLQVVDRIGELIRSEGLPAGAALPTEADLQESFGVSRATVRHALGLLELRGLIERHQGRGTFVAVPPLERSLPELTSFTEHLASQGFHSSSVLVTYRQVPPGASDEDPELPSPDGVDPALFGGQIPLARVVRVRLANEAPVGVHTTLLPLDLADRIGFTEERLRTDPRLSLYACLEREGFLLAEAEEHLRAREASVREARLLSVPRRTAVMSVLRLTRDGRGRLVEAVRAVYLGDRYDYVINLERTRGASERR
jgi:GntR family transcriptional regulator